MPTTVQLIAYLIAIGIPCLFVFLMYAQDVYATSKMSVILICMAWGAVGAFGLAYGINTAVASVIGFALVAALTAPILEEFLKATVLGFYISQPSFRYLVDGGVYGFSVGTGFAAIENVSYIIDTTEPPLTLAVSRVLSTALMHATASAIVGLSLGALRRKQATIQRYISYFSILIAIALHVVFNNLVRELNGVLLLLVAIFIGIGGAVTIGFLINQGLKDEKEAFPETLGEKDNVSTGERQAVQNLGSTSIENTFNDLEDQFGSSKINKIRRLLATQANIGILNNNLRQENVSDRLSKAWVEEIEELKEEVKKLRRELGSEVTTYMNTLFPPSNDTLWQEELGKFDPTLVHTFDNFMRVSELANAFTPEQLMELADRLSNIDLFKNVSLANLENLSRAIRKQDIEPATMIFDQGDAGDAMYLVEEGAIDIILIQEDGSEKKLKTLGAGSVVGEFAVLDGETRSARARSAPDQASSILVLNRQMFLTFIQSRPQVVLAMLQVLAGKARVTTRSVEESIRYARHIADGNYAELKALAAETVTKRPKGLAERIEAAAPTFLGNDGEPTEITEETPSILCRTFAKVAETIEEHEREMQVKIAENPN